MKRGDPSHLSKYLFFCPWPVRLGAGVNNVILGLGESMRADFDSVIVVRGWDKPADDQIWLKMPSPSMPIRNRVGFCLSLVPNLIRLTRLSRGCVAVNPHYFGSEILPLALLRKLRLVPKLILSVHGADVSTVAAAPWLERQLFSWICRSADIVVACSRSLASQVLQLSPDAKIVAIWNGIGGPPKEFGARPIASRYLISVAAFVSKKGHDVLLHAFQQVSKVHPELRLYLIGSDGPQRPAIESLVERLCLKDRVSFLAGVPQKEVWTWVKHAECFVHASREEPFGLAILEAALAGTPVVATAVGGVPEYLTNGVHGLTCQPDRPQELAEAILETLAEPEAARRRAAVFSSHARSFTWDAAWEKYKNLAELRAPIPQGLPEEVPK